MNAQELRSGNWLHSELTNKDFQVNPDDIRSIWLGYDGGMVKPIPLTEEWLIRFGFNKSVRYNCNDIYKDLSARMILMFNNGNVAEMDLIQDGKHISFKHSSIKYVHQLQNLYFSLTGEELTIQQ